MDTPTASVRGDAHDGVAVDDAAPAATATDGTRPGAAAEPAKQALALVGALAVTIPLATITVLWSTRGGQEDLNRSIVVAPFDVVLVLAAVWAITRLRSIRSLFAARAVRLTTTAYAGLFAVALAAHPSPLGVVQGLRLGAGLAVIAAVTEACGASATRRALLTVITIVGVFQAVLGMAQARHGIAFGIDYLDFAGRLYPFGSSRAGRGGLTHPYHLATLLVVAEGAAILGYRGAVATGTRAGVGLRTRWAWVGAIVVLTAGMGVTYSRSAALGQVAIVVAAVASRRERRVLLPVAAAVLAGLLIGGASFGDGWAAKADTTTNAAAVDSNRRVRIEESIDLMRSSPAVGVGPGRYVAALAETHRAEYLPAHDLVAQQGAELGVLGYGLSAALLGLLALRAWRGGAWTMVVAAPLVPFLLLDAYPYVFATGLALSAIWLGLVRTSLRPEPA